jgi:ribosomal protein S18 acetylase RimI-like enzyme
LADAMSKLRVRAMEASDVPEAAASSARAFDVDISEEGNLRHWRERIAYPLIRDPGGAFVAERDGRIIGVAHAMCRERLWCLSLLTVEPGAQSAGAGRALLDRALSYADGTDAGLIVSSNDPRAMRLYARAGFRILPTLQAQGSVDRSSLPRPDRVVREGGAADLEALAPISREVRGAPHTPELEFALSNDAQLLRYGERGFVVVRREFGIWLLVARDPEAATALLWGALERASEGERPIARWLTGAQQWAIEVLVRAGLTLSADGALAVRGDPGPLAPFIPSGPFA